MRAQRQTQYAPARRCVVSTDGGALITHAKSAVIDGRVGLVGSRETYHRRGTQMPRSRSTAIRAERTWRRLPRALTSPANWIAPPNSSNFSVSIVLPASRCEMIATVCTGGGCRRPGYSCSFPKLFGGSYSKQTKTTVIATRGRDPRGSNLVPLVLTWSRLLPRYARRNDNKICTGYDHCALLSNCHTFR
jgi:hypothetical protein